MRFYKAFQFFFSFSFFFFLTLLKLKPACTGMERGLQESATPSPLPTPHPKYLTHKEARDPCSPPLTHLQSLPMANV